ncbi:MAG: glucokinase [Proteobacteria bacterium]|nr:glucokinase [Pseudomonadota bacterium]MBU1709799.1 glucokinase [Pseudomonadota bacterium]
MDIEVISNESKKNIVLAGDIGGTKTNLSLFAGPIADMTLITVRSYPSQNAAHPTDLIAQFLRDEGNIKPVKACIGVAGPVIQGVARAVNLPWDVVEDDFRYQLNLPRLKIVNDLVAMVYSIPYLKQNQFIDLKSDHPADNNGNIGLVAAGTGLGEALLIQDNGRFVPCPSEGGHKDFAATSELQFRLASHLSKKYGHVSVDRILSGRGLKDVYDFFLTETGTEAPEWIKFLMKKENPSAVISTIALEKKDPVCQKTLELFVSVYGAEAGNLALQGMTTSGMYIGGGIAPQIIEALQTETFINAFHNKGRLENLLRQIPVRLIIDPQAPLWGAAALALKICD